MLKFLVVVLVLILGVAIFQSQQKPAQIPNLVVSPLPLATPIPTNNKDMITELKIEDIIVGTGPGVKSGDTIVINYKGTLVDGTKFDSSYDPGRQPFQTQIGVGQVIKGWDVGLLGMKVGGKRKLTIPSSMAYGEQGAGGVIPPNSPLIFELELLAIK
ncbi:MAG TPA: FKBP-type peptidyl-prolyl cis-trans isomerase [Patescibacteria group bacterium]|nr:FKBP-type peptidyl-prolyl cis-trans isomerase [Patescibacteria group bacterium]